MQRHLTLPSVVFAEGDAPNLYGSFRINLHSQDGETSIENSGSRWGMKGTPEVSEGLNVVYRYEQGLDLGNAGLASAKLADDGETVTDVSSGGRLSFIGVSGGFGSITTGQIWSAYYNHVGVVTDIGINNSYAGHSTARTGSTLSYAANTGPVSFQVDVQMDSNGAVENNSVDMTQVGVTLDTGVATIGVAGSSKPLADMMDKEKKDGADKRTGIAFSVPVGDYSFAAAWHQKKVKGEAKDKRTVGAVQGPIADTGMGFGLSMADRQDGTNPWFVQLNRSIGGGASFAFQYADHDMEGVGSESVLRLLIDF